MDDVSASPTGAHTAPNEKTATRSRFFRLARAINHYEYDRLHRRKKRRNRMSVIPSVALLRADRKLRTENGHENQKPDYRNYYCPCTERRIFDSGICRIHNPLLPPCGHVGVGPTRNDGPRGSEFATIRGNAAPDSIRHAITGDVLAGNRCRVGMKSVRYRFSSNALISRFNQSIRVRFVNERKIRASNTFTRTPIDQRPFLYMIAGRRCLACVFHCRAESGQVTPGLFLRVQPIDARREHRDAGVVRAFVADKIRPSLIR